VILYKEGIDEVRKRILSMNLKGKRSVEAVMGKFTSKKTKGGRLPFKQGLEIRLHEGEQGREGSDRKDNE